MKEKRRGGGGGEEGRKNCEEGRWGKKSPSLDLNLGFLT